MTKKEFMGFSSAAQHDMVLEALVRITKNLETMEKESGKPFMGTSKQRRNDIKLLTILAEAFGKNELVWEQKPRVTVDAGKYMPAEKKYCEEDVKGIRDFKDYMDKSKQQPLNPIAAARDAEKKVVVVGVGMERYNSKSMPELLDPVEGIRGIRDDKNKIIRARQMAREFINYAINKES